MSRCGGLRRVAKALVHTGCSARAMRFDCLAKETEDALRLWSTVLEFYWYQFQTGMPKLFMYVVSTVIERGKNKNPGRHLQ